MSTSAHKRRKHIRELDRYGSGCRCPEPCGKVRFLTREAAKAACRKIPDRKMRVYEGDLSRYPCCRDKGIWHITSEEDYTRVAYYRDRHAHARANDLPAGSTIEVRKEPGGRWRYIIHIEDEEPMPSVFTYASYEIAEREAVADLKGESRSA
jgi:hypothetical protein